MKLIGFRRADQRSLAATTTDPERDVMNQFTRADQFYLWLLHCDAYSMLVAAYCRASDDFRFHDTCSTTGCSTTRWEHSHGGLDPGPFRHARPRLCATRRLF